MRLPFGSTALALALGLAACSAPGPATRTACRATPHWDYVAAQPVRIVRVYTDPRTRDSAVDITPLPPKATPLPATGATLYQYDFGPGSKTQIVVGPANLSIPMKPAPYRESFLLLAGNVTLKLADGTTHEQIPGDMIRFEDTDAIRGHGGVTGPCGYVALNIVP